MPYEEHSLVETPTPDTLHVWRYMDFTKFVSLLDHSALFFARLDTLSDPLEGFLTKPTVAQFTTALQDVTEAEGINRESVAKHNLSVMRRSRQLLFVCSWHLNEHESAAMWRLYLKSDEGIAIRSTIGGMKEAFAGSAEKVNIGRISYVDFETEAIPWNNIYYLALHKRKSFEHEREVRAIIMDLPRDDAHGILVSVDLGALIERVYVPPQSSIWFYELVQRVSKRYDLSANIVHSGLDEGPLY